MIEAGIVVLLVIVLSLVFSGSDSEVKSRSEKQPGLDPEIDQRQLDPSYWQMSDSMADRGFGEVEVAFTPPYKISLHQRAPLRR